MPIIVIAPQGSESQTTDLLSQGVDDILYEPLDAGRFRARITAVMRGRGLWSETEEVMRPLIPQDEAERLVEFRLSAAVDAAPFALDERRPQHAHRSPSSSMIGPRVPVPSPNHHARTWLCTSRAGRDASIHANSSSKSGL